MLWQRVLTAGLGIPAILLIFYMAGLPLFLASVVVVVMGIYELIQLEKAMNLNPLPVWSYLIGLNCLLFGIYLWHGQYFALSLWVIVLLSLIHFLLAFPKWSLTDLMATYFGGIYVGGLFSYLILLREVHPQGLMLAFLVFLLTWSGDTGAYFVGVKFGKHSLAPKLSPNKSIEGFLGGLALTVIVAIGFGYFVFSQHLWLIWLLFGVVSAVTGTLGDLLESACKRLAQAKDSGNLLPGHGGLLDRLDSLLLVAPTVYYLVQLFNL